MNEKYRYLKVKQEGDLKYHDEPLMEKPEISERNLEEVNAFIKGTTENAEKIIEEKIEKAIEAEKIKKKQKQIEESLEYNKRAEILYGKGLEETYKKKLEWKKYLEYKEETSLELKSLLNFENSTMGKLMLFWYSITFKNKEDLKKRIEQTIKEKTDEINNAELSALEKREDWMRPQIEEFKNFIEKETRDIESNILSKKIDLTNEEIKNARKKLIELYDSIHNPSIENIHNN